MRVRLLSLGVVAGLAMLAAAGAHADWRTEVSMKEPPNHVLEVWGPERFSVGYGEGAYLFVDGGVERQISVGPTTASAGTSYLLPEDCFITVSQEQGGVRSGVGGDGMACGPHGESIVPVEASVLRVKHAQDGGAVAVVKPGSGSEPTVFLSGSGVHDSAPFSPFRGDLRSLSSALGVLRVGNEVHALLGTTMTDSRVYWIMLSNPTWAEPMSQSDSSSAVVQAIELFSAGDPAKPFPYAVVGTQRGLLQGSTLASMDPLKPVHTFEGDAGVLGVSMNVGAGGDAGQGFGMAIVELPDGGRQVASPVPMLADTQAGTVWRVRSIPESVATAPLNQVACTGASYCVFTAGRADAGNLFIYTNDAGPEISVTAPDAGVVESGTETVVTLDEGQRYRLTFAAEDPDGDPVLVTASPLSVSTGTWTVVPDTGQRPGDPVVLDVTPSATCASQGLGSFTVAATDGLARHEAYETVQVYVKHTRPPEPPAAELSDGGVPGSGAGSELFPGGPPLMLRLAGGGTTAAGCRVHPEWEPLFSGTGVPSLEEDAGTAIIAPPDRFCSPTAGSFGFRLRVTDDEGLSNSTDFNVRVAPWGRPNAVFGADSAGELIAGQQGVIVPTQTSHVCEGESPDFPGVDTEWSVTLPDGGMPGHGMTFQAEVDGGRVPVQSFPVQAERLVVETLDCIEEELRVSAGHRLRTSEGFTGPESQHRLRVRTELTDFAQGELLLGIDGDEPPSDELRVNVDSTLNCPTRRGLRAQLWLERLDGGEQMPPGTVSLPGSWQASLAQGCGRPLLVKGVLEDNAGQRSREFSREVATPRVETGLEPLRQETSLVAQCGAQSRITLTQTFPESACQAPDVTWAQEGGPPLEESVLSGPTVTLITRDTGLDALVGQSLVMRVTASAGPGNETSQLVTLPITVEPFVKVRRRTELPAASETGLVGVSVDLHNTSTCGVSGVSYVERLEGLTYVEGSAKFNGQPVSATWDAGALTVTGLTLAGEGTGKLTYVARPHLVGERRMEGEAWLRNEVISLRDTPGPQVPDSGCGCSGSGSGPVLFALGALVAAGRRRRR